MSEKLTYAAPKEDVTSLNTSAGGGLNTGNTKSYQLQVGGDFRLVRRPHAISANAAFAYGGADLPSDNAGMVTTVQNLNARAKYELFLSDMDALFLATGFRWDPFAGISRRNNGQIGYGRYFISEAKHRFWGEIGYDLTGTKYRSIKGKPDSVPEKSSEIVHSARIFLGYENQLNDFVSYLGGIEGLVNLEHPKASRLNWENALRSTLNGSFKLELKFKLAYEAQPVVTGAKKVDTATVVSLLYSLL